MLLNRKRHIVVKKFFLYLIFFCISIFAAVNDVVPTDYMATESGSTYMTLYGYERIQDGPYSKNNKATPDLLNSAISILRISHSLTIDNMQVTPMIVIPYATASSHGQILPHAIGEKTAGFGDIRIGNTVWLKKNSIEKEYFAITTTISIPTGKYDKKQSLNIGEDRYKAILSAGYTKRIASSNNGELFFEISPEIAYYWASKDSQSKTVTQKPTYAVTEYIRYRPRPIYSVFIGAQQNFGGETSINGAPQNNEANNQKLMIGGIVFVFDTQIMLRYGKDVAVKNGFGLKDELLLRLQKRF
jgi:hypothetical protein